jgi:hypothetical protein
MIELGPKDVVASVTYGATSDLLEITFSDPLRGNCGKYEIEIQAIRTVPAGMNGVTNSKVTITNPGSGVVTDRCNVTPTVVQRSKITTDGFLAVFKGVIIGVVSKSGTSYVSSLKWINITVTSYPRSGAPKRYSKVLTTWNKTFPNPTVQNGTVRSDGSTTGIAPVVIQPAPAPVPTYATGSYIPRGVNDSYSSYWVYPKADYTTQPHIPKLYWEDLNIKVETTGMFLRAVIVNHQAGSIKLTDQYGVTWTHIPTNTNWNSDISIPQTLNIIVKIEFNAGTYGYGAASIKNSAGTVVWNTQNPWKHSV